MTGYDDDDDDRRPRNPSLSLITALALLWHLFRLFFFQRGTKRANGFLAKQESAPSSIFVESRAGRVGRRGGSLLGQYAFSLEATQPHTHTHTHTHTLALTHSFAL